MIFTEMRRAPQDMMLDLMVETSGTMKDIPTLHLVGLEMGGSQRVAKAIPKHSLSPLVVTQLPAEIHLALVLVIYFPDSLVVG